MHEVPPRLIAQSLGEYGALSSFGATIQQATDSVAAWLGSVTITTWVVAGAVFCLALFVWTRRR